MIALKRWINKNYYSTIFLGVQPIAISTDFVFNNQFATIILTNLTAIITAYFYHKFKNK